MGELEVLQNLTTQCTFECERPLEVRVLTSKDESEFELSKNAILNQKISSNIIR